MSPARRPDPEAHPLPWLPELIASFNRVAAGMADLPFYNPALSVEAVGFQRFGGESLGVLITPWFMNLMLVADEPEPYAQQRTGTRRLVEFPTGPQTFLRGGTEDFGMFWSRSLASPMDAYRSQPPARAAARLALARLLRPPADSPASEDDGAAMSRRTLLSPGRAAGGNRRG